MDTHTLPRQELRATLLAQIVTIDIDEIARILKRSRSTILSDLCRNPDRLPPSIKLGKTRVWLLSTVLDWLQSHEKQTKSAAEVFAKPAKLPTRRGRRTKAEIIRMARLENAS